MFRKVRNLGAALSAAIVLVACGGGGGGDASGNLGYTPVQPPPTSVENILPSGARIDVSAKNLFPLGLNDVWTYRELDAASRQTGTVTLTVSAASGNQRTVRETPNGSPGGHAYLKTPEGIADANFDPTLPSGIQTAVNPLQLYVEPLYPAGTTRILRRSGSANADLNGDGVSEGFRFDYDQVFLGFESLKIGRKTMEAAHFSNTTRITLTSSNPKDSPVTVVATEEAYFVAGFGLVKQLSEVRDGDGRVLEPPSTIELFDATVGGQQWGDFIAVEATVRIVSVPHNSVVYDVQNQRYYLSVPAAAPSHPNSLATIDPVTGTVSYRDLPGLDPAALAIASDGRSLYVAANGTSQIKRLGLPGLNEIQSFAVPPRRFNRASKVLSIATSPTSADVIAIGTFDSDVDAILFRNGVAQPAEAFSAGGRLQFDFSGNRVFSVFGSNLFELTLQANGLALTKTGSVFTGPEVTLAPAGLVIGDRTYFTDTLASGYLLRGNNCAAQRSAIFCRVVETPQPPAPGGASTEQVFLFDPTTRNPITNVSIGKPYERASTLLQGPKGQIGISRLRADGVGYANDLTLVEHPSFP